MTLYTSRTRAAKIKAQEEYTATDIEVSEILGKINETTLTIWPNKQKKQQGKEI
jgi:hypothetical protein